MTKSVGSSKRKMVRPKTGVGVEISVRCKDCVHFDKVPLYNKETCNNQGVQSWSKPCKGFTLNPHLIKFSKNKDFENLFSIVKNLNSEFLAPLATILATEHRTRLNKLHGGQEVFLYIGQDYLGSYVSAKVISCTAEHVYVEGANGFEGTVLRKTLLTLEEFKKKRNVLQQEKLLINPEEDSFKVTGNEESLLDPNYLPPLVTSI